MKSSVSNISPLNTAVTVIQTFRKEEALLKPNTLEQDTQLKNCQDSLY